MSTALRILSLLENQFDDFSPYGEYGLVTYIDTAQSLLCANCPAEQFVIIGSDGKLPAVTTETDVYRYNLPSNVLRVLEVGVEIGQSGTYLDSYYGSQDYGLRKSVRSELERFVLSGINYYRVPHIRSSQHDGSNVASLTFTVNPGTSSLYRYMAIRRPTPVTSESVELMIPHPHDIQFLLPAAARLVQAARNGDYIDAYQYIQGVLARQLTKAMNRGAQGFDLNAEARGF